MRLTLAAVLVAAMAATAAPAANEEIPTRDCRSRIESGRGPLAFPTADSVFVGPIALTALPFAATRAGLGPRREEDGRFYRKAGALVRAGRPVVLSVPERYRDRLFLHYTRTDEGVAEVRLEPCPPGMRAFSYRGRVGKVTGFNGGFSLTHRGCYPLDVRVEGGRTHRVRIAFGYPCR
ncbi:MAG TPA: hypothetical protein VNP89_01675 [Gaiellaceae bacterium]|nr:hypothetical protein [Gaiellaceae bacterium]